MTARVWNALRIEWMKARRRPYTHLGIVLVIAAVLSAMLVRPIVRDGRGDYVFLAYATPMALDLLGLLVVVMFSASLVSTELSRGTACLVLVRPIRRHEFLLAKFLTAITYAAFLTIATVVSSWAPVAIFGDLTGVTFGGESVYTNVDMILTYLAAALLGFLPLAAAAAYGVMMSTLMRSTAAAVGLSVGLWILVDIIKYPLRIAPFLFSTYIETPWQIFSDRAEGIYSPWGMEEAFLIGTSTVWMTIFLTISISVFSRRNLQS